VFSWRYVGVTILLVNERIAARMKTARGSRLGRDFWLYQGGQVISTVGDACGNIALTWWILDVTGSSAMISSILAPAMIVQMSLTPVLGPLGDRLSRKRLILSSDLVRGVAIAALATMALRGSFAVPVIIGIYALFAAGSALFNSNNMSIVPQLVPADALQGAVQMSQSVNAIGRVVGGAVAGILVSTVGVGWTLLVDAASFGIAALMTAAIVGSVRGAAGAGTTDAADHRTSSFSTELTDGFAAVHRVPLLFSLCIAIAFFNLLLSPMQVLLPTYAKVTRQMPAWFLGGLESSLGGGIIVGALGIGILEKTPRLLSSVVVGLLLLGAGTAFLSHVPGIVAPMALMFLIGLGAAWTNIPIGTRVSVAVPDHFRSRVNSIFAFIFDASAPIGVAAGGALVAWFGVTVTMSWLGILMLIAVPVLFLMPGFTEFFRASPSELTDHFLKAYPHVFGRGVREPLRKPDAPTGV
jgi:MFS transporter, DHA3 family, macrolide efflux protein